MMSNVFDERVEFAVQNLWVIPNVEKSREARRMLEEAAGEGDGDACFFLARCCFGESFVDPRFGFEDDDEKGERWLEKGLERGSAVTMFGAMRVGGFKPGKGTFVYPPYSSLREIWDQVEKKAMAGQVFCKYMIANAYYYGDVIQFMGMDSNAVSLANVVDFQNRAISLYEGIIASGSVLGISNLINIITSGDYGMPKNEKRAKELRHIGASRGVASFERMEGRDLEEAGNIQEAAEMYERAMEHNDADACYRLGRLYSYNGKLPLDLKRAIECFSRGIELSEDVTGCCNRLGEIYFYGGQDIEPDYNRAVELFLRVRADNSWSSDMLGTCYLKGWGIQQDYGAARKEFEVKPSSCLCSLGLGEIYAYGRGVKRDIKKAMEYWNRFPDHPRAIEYKSHFKKTLFGWSEV